MVEARNANYATISRHLWFGKRGAANAETEATAASKPDKGRTAPDAPDNGSDSDTEAPPEPKLLRVSHLSISVQILSITEVAIGVTS